MRTEIHMHIQEKTLRKHISDCVSMVVQWRREQPKQCSKQIRSPSTTLNHGGNRNAVNVKNSTPIADGNPYIAEA